jgi:hypothetical protein
MADKLYPLNIFVEPFASIRSDLVKNEKEYFGIFRLFPDHTRSILAGSPPDTNSCSVWKVHPNAGGLNYL